MDIVRIIPAKFIIEMKITLEELDSLLDFVNKSFSLENVPEFSSMFEFLDQLRDLRQAIKDNYGT